MIDVLKNCYVGEKLQNDATKMDQINIKWIKHGSIMVNVPPWSVNVLILMYLTMCKYVYKCEKKVLEVGTHPQTITAKCYFSKYIIFPKHIYIFFSSSKFSYINNVTFK